MNQRIRHDLVCRESLGPSKVPKAWVPVRVKPQRESLEGRSLPLTILWALEKLNRGDAWSQRDTLNIHILAADIMEVVHCRVFEEILHQLPKIKTLKIVMFNREFRPCNEGGVEDITPCPCTTYPNYVTAKGAAYTPPDLAVGFNAQLCGMREGWLPTLKLLSPKKIPSVFTSYTLAEAAEDSKILRAAGAQLIPGLEGRNPWGSQLIFVEPILAAVQAYTRMLYAVSADHVQFDRMLDRLNNRGHTLTPHLLPPPLSYIFAPVTPPLRVWGDIRRFHDWNVMVPGLGEFQSHDTQLHILTFEKVAILVLERGTIPAPTKTPLRTKQRRTAHVYVLAWQEQVSGQTGICVPPTLFASVVLQAPELEEHQ
ncbi:hypothetical protein PHLGIDRAFT_16582 [Phlebiopsis gigantea 11061_1 CR5-6]|uniref:Mitochondrial splicing suppressor 51-like C-terminal domain-containing protein n=1 Tax=Phlebiopsis gigantea (strain 11061_1 CR5-6) TaxID=745531 RepID=A0A0C3S3E8_PHLG1|nr:hypothetical protein PHLGIDRAFT_16582 [Phlebiopsis gigantea 11061_1 CR5-6]